MPLLDALVVVTAVTASNIASDLAARYFVYSKPELHKAAGEAEVLGAQIALLEARGAGAKKAEAQLVQLRRARSNVLARTTGAALPATFATTAVLLGTIWVLSTVFAGVVFARLPFEPTDMLSIRAMLRRGLDDATSHPRDVGYMFFFIMANMLSRLVISKVAPNLNGAPKGVGPGAGGPNIMDQLKEAMGKKD
jgi:hypothetical protein